MEHHATKEILDLTGVRKGRGAYLRESISDTRIKAMFFLSVGVEEFFAMKTRTSKL